VTVRKALETALPEVGSRFSNQPLVEARLRFTLGTSFANLGEAKIATDQIQRARDLFAKYRGPDHPDTLKSMLGLANCYDGLGRHPEALKLHEETLVLMKAKLGPEDALTLMAMNSLATSYGTVGEKDKALKLYEETLAIRKARFGPDEPGTLGTMNNLAGMYSALGRHDDALKLGKETVAHFKERLGPRHRFTLSSMDTLASIYHNCGQFHEAVKQYELTLPLMKDILGPDHSVTLSCMMGLANSYSALGRHSEELKIREETVARRQVRLDPGHPDTLDSLNRLAWLLAVCPDAKIRDPNRALTLAQKAVELAPQSEWSRQVLGWARYRTGNWQDSVSALEKSILLRKDGGNSYQWFFLAMAYWQLGNKEKAREFYDRAVEWMDKNQPKNVELRRFRAEASQLLELKEKK
jgi:tetratricopeptide (TPR) repeat protein